MMGLPHNANQTFASFLTYAPLREIFFSRKDAKEQSDKAKNLKIMILPD